MHTTMTLEEAQTRLIETYRDIESRLSPEEWKKGKLSSERTEIYNNYSIVDKLYIPDDKLNKRIDEYFAWCRKERKENAGHLMEEIAALAFGCLSGWEDLESYQSYASQNDLVITGSSDLWYTLMEYLHLPKNGRTIVIEAKNLKDKVEDKHFSRLGSIIQTQFDKLCHLAVFVSSTGATGFTSRRKLSDARATQVLFHAKTAKYLVIITADDFEKLKEIGGLPKLLEAKIRDVEISSNIPLEYGDDWIKVNLPPHIARYFQIGNRKEL